MRKRISNLRGEDGQALVELALVVPLLLFILFAIIDFGLALNQYNDATNLANVGARATAVAANSTPSCVYTSSSGVATTYTTLAGYLDCEGAIQGTLNQTTVTVCDSTGTSTLNTGDSVAIKVNSSFNWLKILTGGIGSIGGVVGPSSTIGSSATMRMEGTVTVNTTSGWFANDTKKAPGTSSTVQPLTLTTSC